MAYAELEPFGPDADAWRFGVVAATIANVNRDPKKRRQPFTPQDFMPDTPQTPEERQAALQARISAVMMGLGGRTRRPDDPPRARRRKQGGTDGA